MEHKYIKHIPTQCCYELEDDGKTIEICGCRMQPVVDGKIFWEYTDEYVEKIVVPSDPFVAHKVRRDNMILDGKIVAEQIKGQLKEEIATSGRRPPHLVIITVGEDPASKVYVRNKIKACEEVGIKTTHKAFTADEGGEFLVREVIARANFNSDIDGIMVQLPLPEGYDERVVIDTIYPFKDVDGLTTTNIGKLRSGQPCFQPCTARGVIDLLDYYGIEMDGKNVTIIGRSNIVGKPLADLMMARGATVTQCHSRTKYLCDHTEYADIIVSAVGKPRFIDFSYLGSDKVVVDVGINRDEDGKLCGDVDFDEVVDYCSAITPVPGGVGPMTVAELLRNTVEVWKKNMEGDK